MIELAFGESPAGALKMAKSMKQGQRLNDAVAIGVIGGTEEEQREVMREAMRPRVWSGITMDGSSRDVAALTLALDIGDISDLNARKKVLDGLLAQFPGAADSIWETNRQTLARLQETKATLEPVRMWVCAGDPAEVCGLYFVCHLLADAGTPLAVVRIPDQVEKDDSVISYRSTGEVSPEALSAFAEHEEPISELRRGVYADIWSGLVRENAPLRAVVNGSLMGVPKDFYDFALRANMPDGEFKVAQLIGKTLGKVPGVGDRWLFLRIQAMLQAGELVTVSAATEAHPYSGVVKRQS